MTRGEKTTFVIETNDQAEEFRYRAVKGRIEFQKIMEIMATIIQTKP